ncbi:hypothetical protein B0T14DRAFT_283661 [Immersiella caudata]|uniref:Uncharacterized protein n=1 Tax=Immersiella caudata TaxID=314043 RepID=A0AA39WE33_9PEZI|nr:hypothetical protein B0T14DRAFT_283661 [Immersiella caudata]
MIFVNRARNSLNRRENGNPGLGTNRIIFIDFVGTPAIQVSRRKLRITHSCFAHLCTELRVPAYFVNTIIRHDQLGRLGFGAYLHPSGMGPGSFELSYRYTPRLAERTLDLNTELRYVYTRYNVHNHSSLTLCINPHPETRDLWIGRVPTVEGHQQNSSAKSSVGAIRAKEELRSPLAFHILITHMSLEDWKTSLEEDRSKLEDLEDESKILHRLTSSSKDSHGGHRENAPSPNDANDIENQAAAQPKPKTPSRADAEASRLVRVHENAQRLLIAENSCRDIENRVQLLLRSVEILRSIPKKFGEWGKPKRGKAAHNGIVPSTLDREQQILESILLSCRHSQQWTRCYEERTSLQIQLDFNLITSNIATETQKDTSAMNRIAAVTTLFLPGTFISAVLSMGFFNFAENGNVVINRWLWVYFVLAVPVTRLVFLALKLMVWLGNRKREGRA